ATAQIAETTTKTVAKRRWRPRRAELDFAPGEAVSITRRLYRSGESDYLLNGRACRLRDIHDLFSGTGLAGASYALIQQERISQILSSKPSDRRSLIEEAAGISKFRTRQRAAEVRLESAKTNLRRLADIIAEVERQANSLRRQASRTRRFKELQEDLRELLRKTFSAEGRELTETLEDARGKLASAATEELKLVQAVAEKAARAQLLTQIARETEANLAEIREQISQAALQRERAARDFAHQTEQAANLEERCAALRHEIKANEERLKLVSEDAARLREKNRQSNSSNETESASLQAAEIDYRQKQAEVEKIETAIEKLRSELLQHTAAAGRLREIARQQIDTLERLVEQAAGLKREGERAAATFQEKQTEAADLQAQIDAGREQLSDLQKQKQVALETVKTAQENLRTSEKALGKIRDEANGVAHKRETLEKLDSNNAMLAPAVQKLLAAQEKAGINAHGTLADFLQVEARFEKAVEAVFGSHLQTVLVETPADAFKISEWLKTGDFGRLNVLSLDSTTISRNGSPKKARNSEPQNIGSVLGLSADLSEILRSVMPAEMNFRIVGNLNEAANFAGESCVTLEGDLILQNRLFSLGKTNAKSGGILSFKRELRELAARAAELKTTLETAETEVKTAREKLQKQEDVITDFQSQILLAERELMSLESDYKSLQQERERAERHAKVVADETARLEREKAETEAKREKAETDAQTAEDARLSASKRLDEIASGLQEAKKAAEKSNASLGEKRAIAAAETERRRSLANALRRVETEERELTTQIDRKRNELSQSTERLEQLRVSLAELETRNSRVANEKTEEAGRITEASENLRQAREAADKSAVELSELNAQAARSKDARASFEVLQAQTATRLENLRENCLQELSQPLENLFSEELFENFDLAEEKRRVESLREKLENFGAVNLLALEELNEAEERLLFLTSQKKDIVDSILSAEEALQEIKRRSRERFERAFAEINRNFTALFSELFGGGKGEMNLLDASDVLESGIEIVAQPPGKRLQNLLLLSGGEKAMTAIALVLAIFRFHPSPFCLLDEVDAPLDEANVGRFVGKIAEMSVNTQFIVITHNKRTMEAARALYGVTMEEAGVSKVVSVKFD
ncbi:MAG TPA: chromosome segregation protein SMC, partial [Pyrinomonadaceae bacterium]|nr:chromosome segregation protein SMC [Pyrinomonadaceae bacterium]